MGGQIEVLATALKLPTVRRMYSKLAREVTAMGGDYETYLLWVLREEMAERDVRRVERRIKEARFPQVKLLSDLDFKAQSMPPKAQLMTLAECDYIAQGTNILALGNSGTGKTHVATGLGVAACQRGLRVRFWTVATLASELLAAQDEHQLHRYLARFGRWDLVILDELGYVPLGKSAAELLFQAIGERHEHGSLVLTSNLPFNLWTEIFHTERLTAAILDRITDRATILAMNGPSFRLSRSLELASQTQPPPDTAMTARMSAQVAGAHARMIRVGLRIRARVCPTRAWHGAYRPQGAASAGPGTALGLLLTPVACLALDLRRLLTTPKCRTRSIQTRSQAVRGDAVTRITPRPRARTGDRCRARGPMRRTWVWPKTVRRPSRCEGKGLVLEAWSRWRGRVQT